MSLTRYSIASLIICSALALRTTDDYFYGDEGNELLDELEDDEGNESLDDVLEAFFERPHEAASPPVGTSTLQKAVHNTLEEKKAVLVTAHITAHDNSLLQKSDNNTYKKDAENADWFRFQHPSLTFPYELSNIISEMYSGFVNSSRLSCHPNCSFEVKVERNRTTAFSLLHQSSEQLRRFIVSKVAMREDLPIFWIALIFISEAFIIGAGVYWWTMATTPPPDHMVTIDESDSEEVDDVQGYGSRLSVPSVNLTVFRKTIMQTQTTLLFSPAQTEEEHHARDEAKKAKGDALRDAVQDDNEAKTEEEHHARDEAQKAKADAVQDDNEPETTTTDTVQDEAKKAKADAVQDDNEAKTTTTDTVQDNI